MGLLQFAINFTTEECYKCGIPFAVTSKKYNELRNNGAEFFCPNGHGQHYTETEVIRLKKQVENEKRQREWAEQHARNNYEKFERAENQKKAYKGVITKIKNRVGHGVCPCCKRTFSALARHMKTKHPDFAVEV